MTIIINDYQPAGDTTEVVFPGSKKRFRVPTSEALTLGQLRSIQSGDIDAFCQLFDTDVQTQLDRLHPKQLNEFIGAWLKTDTSEDAPKD